MMTMMNTFTDGKQYQAFTECDKNLAQKEDKWVGR